jgi:hypothetical protein
MVHAALKSEHASPLFRWRDVRQQRVARRAADAFPEPIDEP